MQLVSVIGLIGTLTALLTSSSAFAAPPACEKDAAAGLPKPPITFSMEDEKRALSFLIKEAPLKAHFALSPLIYPYNGLKMYGFELSVIVSEDGRVACATITPPYRAQDPVMTPQRRAFLEDVGNWRFDPYFYEGKPSRVAIAFNITEEEQPRQHRPAPKGDPDQIVIVQENRPWFSSYSPYRVELHGDGRAVYQSFRKNDPLGRQAYKVEASSVQGLLEKAKTADFWSLRDTYRRSPNAITHASSSLSLSIVLGGQKKSVTDYSNNDSGKPRALETLHQEVMQAANLNFWEIPGLDTLEQLKINGFDFQSVKAGQFLIETAANPRVENAVILSLMDLGAPLDHVVYDKDTDKARSLLDISLTAGREPVAHRLIGSGALKTSGKTDRNKVNDAFLGAIESGCLAIVEMILPYNPDISSDAVLYVGRSNAKDEDKISVLELLLAKGADINSRDTRGQTLLHEIALTPEFVAYLIENGADLNAIADDGSTPLMMAFLEDTALLMLEKGADPRINKTADYLRFNVKRNGWLTVGRWLTEHGYADMLLTPPGDKD
ncbi:ankyrin repeat domain-containing protein [Asticcacaulis sp.]|uniref:DUF6438 domain-containing protein n=1 Tax=Asticcacaulis sp. TaxID=1872648 RepID=UPI002637D679|nr:ankyrin repeat domain-containing protein [Asticcacaulis sp.]